MEGHVVAGEARAVGWAFVASDLLPRAYTCLCMCVESSFPRHLSCPARLPES